MIRLSLKNQTKTLSAACAAAIATLSFCGAASAQTAEQSYYLLTSDSGLAQVLESQAATPTAVVAVSGLNPGDQLVAIDVRPQTGRLYGLGQNPKTGTVQLYILQMNSSSATAVALGSAQSFVDAAGAPLLILANGYDIDFNPSVDRLRVVSTNGINFRMNPNDGALVDGNFGGAAGSVAGINPDARLTVGGANAQAMATSYSNNEINTGITTQYVLDHVTNQLYVQQPPNAGTLASPLTITLGGTPLDFASDGGLDIQAGINASASGAVAVGEAAAVLVSAGTSRLYRINLATGAATLRGNLGGLNVIDIAVANSRATALTLSNTGTQLARFNLDAPGASALISVSGVAAGERLVGMDLRPRTGQIFALGIDAALDRGTLYRLEPQSMGTTALASAIGATGQIAFVDSTGQVLDLSDVSYGVDFNPVADRVRVVDAGGNNFRINPDTGAPVDGDSVAPGINPDGAISAALGTQLGATAYTNSVNAPSATTQYTIDQLGSTLYVQNPPNSGAQTLGLGITLAGQALEFGGGVGFDIAPGVFTSATNMPVMAGLGYFTSSPAAGQPQLYQIALATGVATALGAIATAGQDVDSLIVTQSNASFALSVGSLTVMESATPAVITLNRTGGGAQLLRYTTSDGTALAGLDYTASSGTVFFGAGDASASISIPILLDALDEPEETFTITLQGASGAATALTVRIVSDRIFVNGFE
jgi:hypothetical protein